MRVAECFIRVEVTARSSLRKKQQRMNAWPAMFC